MKFQYLVHQSKQKSTHKARCQYFEASFQRSYQMALPEFRYLKKQILAEIRKHHDRRIKLDVSTYVYELMIKVLKQQSLKVVDDIEFYGPIIHEYMYRNLRPNQR